MLPRSLVTLLAAVLLVPAAARAQAAPGPSGPDGDAFYAPPPGLVGGTGGSLVWSRPATGPAVLRDAARTDLVLFRSRSLADEPIVQSATVAVPPGSPPNDGWPLVSWFHVTTGSADTCAPSRATPSSTELERMTRGDVIVNRMLRAGVAVVRPDGEGLGTPGAHPYLVGPSLARSQSDAARAARALHPRIGRRWAAAGHSEGAVASLFSAALGRELAPELDLRAVAAFSPVTKTREQLELLRHDPLRGPPHSGLSGLAALIIPGAAEDDRALRPMLRAGGLSPRATALLPHVEDRCLVDLGAPGSWGDLAPAEIPGPAWDRGFGARLARVLERNDPANAVLRTPVRIDHGLADLVAPLPLTEALVATQRRRGAAVAYGRWPTASHVDITGDGQAGPTAVRWLLDRLR